jgi:hypothetical protein
LSVLLLLLQAAVPLVHHAGESESCFAVSMGSHAGTAGTGTALDPSRGTEAQDASGHDPLHCLFCRTISRLDGHGQTVPLSGTVVVEATGESISLTDEVIPHHDLTNDLPTRAPPVSV